MLSLSIMPLPTQQASNPRHIHLPLAPSIMVYRQDPSPCASWPCLVNLQPRKTLSLQPAVAPWCALQCRAATQSTSQLKYQCLPTCVYIFNISMYAQKYRKKALAFPSRACCAIFPGALVFVQPTHSEPRSIRNRFHEVQ
jgi:hypothetical protein